MNHALAHALTRAGLTPVDVASRLGVDPKTVERWLAGRVPHPRHRTALRALVDVPETALWPGAGTRSRRPGGRDSEIVAVYPHRWMVLAEVWRDFFSRAQHELGILVYSGLFLLEDAAILRIFADKAAAGVRVRLLLGDPTSPHVAQRGTDEGIGDAMSARIRNALVLVRPLLSVPGIELRMHGTTLYNSIFLADDALLVNTHVLGRPATHAPVLCVVRPKGKSPENLYYECFERVWEGSIGAGGEKGG
jgi:transcriptional regulator with XRE-family HTH domain